MYLEGRFRKLAPSFFKNKCVLGGEKAFLGKGAGPFGVFAVLVVVCRF